MNKFWAKVRFKKGRNAEYLIKAFFQDFNPESSIVVRGKEAKLEIVFREEETPMKIINAISNCEVIELNYGKNLKEYEEDETIQLETENDSKQENSGSESSEQIKRENVKDENSEQAEQEVVESENSEQTEQENVESEKSKQIEQENVERENSEQTEQENVESENSEQIEQENVESEKSKQIEQQKKKRDRLDTKKVEPAKVTKPEPTSISIPELEEIAKKATSFANFAKLVAEWLEMDKRQEFFKNLVIVSAEIDKMTWKELEKALKCKNVFYTQWDKIWSSKQISEKLKEHSVTMLSFLNVTRQYKEYSFGKVTEFSIEENSTKRATKETTKNVARLKMACMPEIKEFEELLASVDKTQPVEDRVRYVLNAMGLNKMPVEEQKQIVEIASIAVRKERMAFDIIFVEAKIPINQTMDARMTFTKFVNDFVKKYESGKKIQLLTFLSELQKIIMLESEIESFSDFTD